MTEPTPSTEALEAARELFEDIDHNVQGRFTQRERARKEIALALDRFRAAGVAGERQQTISDLRQAAAHYGRSGYGDALNDFANELEIVP